MLTLTHMCIQEITMTCGKNVWKNYSSEARYSWLILFLFLFIEKHLNNEFWRESSQGFSALLSETRLEMLDFFIQCRHTDEQPQTICPEAQLQSILVVGMGNTSLFLLGATSYSLVKSAITHLGVPPPPNANFLKSWTGLFSYDTHHFTLPILL